MSDSLDVVTDNTNDDTAPAPDTGDKQVENKTFTQEEVNRIVAERLSREKSKFEEQLKETQSAKDDESKTELQKLQEQIAALTQENETSKLEALKARISKETSVPVELLTGTDEESLTAQAAAIQEYVESKATKSTKTDTQKPGQPLKEGAAPASQSREDILAQVMGRK